MRRLSVCTIALLPVPPAPTTSITGERPAALMACAICRAVSRRWMPRALTSAASRNGRAPARCSTLSGGSPTGRPASLAAFQRAATASYSPSVIGSNGSVAPSSSGACCRYQTVLASSTTSPSGRTC